MKHLEIDGRLNDWANLATRRGCIGCALFITGIGGLFPVLCSRSTA
ncbi:MAG: hypothetical protein ACK45T_13190 [Pseudanabaena sp.]|nr:hypothetical protein [Pseudanabaena sp. M046S1SP1A06QC]